MDPLYIQIILGALGIAIALALILAPMFGSTKQDEYYSALSDWEDEWQARNEARKQRRQFDDSKNG